MVRLLGRKREWERGERVEWREEREREGTNAERTAESDWENGLIGHFQDEGIRQQRTS